VQHLRAGVGLLAVGCQRDRVELADRVVALEDDARILPRDRRAGLYLGPRDVGGASGALATLGSYFGLRWSQRRLNYWIGMLIAIAYLGATACLGFARTSVSIDPFSLVALGFAWGCALPYLISLLAVRVIPSINRDSA